MNRTVLLCLLLAGACRHSTLGSPGGPGDMATTDGGTVGGADMTRLPLPDGLMISCSGDSTPSDPLTIAAVTSDEQLAVVRWSPAGGWSPWTVVPDAITAVAGRSSQGAIVVAERHDHTLAWAVDDGTTLGALQPIADSAVALAPSMVGSRLVWGDADHHIRQIDFTDQGLVPKTVNGPIDRAPTLSNSNNVMYVDSAGCVAPGTVPASVDPYCGVGSGRIGALEFGPFPPYGAYWLDLAWVTPDGQLATGEVSSGGNAPPAWHRGDPARCPYAICTVSGDGVDLLSDDAGNWDWNAVWRAADGHVYSYAHSRSTEPAAPLIELTNGDTSSGRAGADHRTVTARRGVEELAYVRASDGVLRFVKLGNCPTSVPGATLTGTPALTH